MKQCWLWIHFPFHLLLCKLKRQRVEMRGSYLDSPCKGVVLQVVSIDHSSALMPSAWCFDQTNILSASHPWRHHWGGVDHSMEFCEEGSACCFFPSLRVCTPLTVWLTAAAAIDIAAVLLPSFVCQLWLANLGVVSTDKTYCARAFISCSVEWSGLFFLVFRPHRTHSSLHRPAEGTIYGYWWMCVGPHSTFKVLKKYTV